MPANFPCYICVQRSSTLALCSSLQTEAVTVPLLASADPLSWVLHAFPTLELMLACLASFQVPSWQFEDADSALCPAAAEGPLRDWGGHLGAVRGELQHRAVQDQDLCAASGAPCPRCVSLKSHSLFLAVAVVHRADEVQLIQLVAPVRSSCRPVSEQLRFRNASCCV